ncbi:hypothetical protein UlMin_002950 [Ulmus minor]
MGKRYYYIRMEKKKKKLQNLKERGIISFLILTFMSDLCRNLWKGVSKDKRTSFAYFDSLWFNLYVKSSHKEKVLTWIKNKHIFSKKYVFIPIVRWLSLEPPNLLCESLESETKKPCMLLLEPDIRNLPLLDPKIIVPRQRNDGERGNFVLYFIKLFMEGAPETFSKDMKKYWFTPEGMLLRMLRQIV